jgi:AcrR family transcriptional regulator
MTTTKAPGRPRFTADERRDSVIAAASREFAAHGYAGTSTQTIAHRVGVSQPYLFQLFGTKEDLFLASVRGCFTRLREAFEASATTARAVDPTPTAILHAMAQTYCGLLQDRDMLRLQLQAYAACGDPAVQAVVRGEWERLYQTVSRISGADDESLHAWFAEGMLLNVAAAIGGGLDEAIRLKLATPGQAAAGGDSADPSGIRSPFEIRSPA